MQQNSTAKIINENPNKENIQYVTVEKIVKVPVEKEVTKYIVVDRPIEVYKDRIINRYVDKIVNVDRPVQVIKEVVKDRPSQENSVANCMVNIQIAAKESSEVLDDSEDDFEIID